MRLGLSRRKVQSMAARGSIPGAARFDNLWTFCPHKLNRFIEEQEAKCAADPNASATYTAAAASGICAQSSTASKSASHFTHAMRRLRGSTATGA
jgi:hypothetical protein